MIKKFFTNYIKRNKNKDFQVDDNIESRIIIYFLIEKFISLIRSLKFLNFNNRYFYLFFGKKVNLFYKSNIKFGSNVVVGDYVKIYSLGKRKVTIGNNSNIGSFSHLITSVSFNNIGEHIRIGNNVGLGEFAYIGGAGGAEIGDDTIIGQYFSVHPENHNFLDKKKLIREQGVTRKGIKIGSNCWIGSKVTILDGVVIGDNSVIAAGALVNRSYPKNSLIAGVPAKLIKKI